MKKNFKFKIPDDIDIQYLSVRDPQSFLHHDSFFSNVAGYLKILAFSGLFIGSGLLLNSCVGYVASEPSYVEYERPLRPGPAYIWIDGGWHWDYHRHIYVQRPGYWERPHVGRTFVTGHWQNTPRGKRWVEGHWQREGIQREHRER